MLNRASLKGLSAAAAVAAALAVTSAPAAAADAPAWKSQAGKYAVFDTTEGKIVCILYEKEAPKTVENFTGLATGTKEFKDAATGNQAKRPFYDGTKFHRIIPGFMMQGGDPLGTGTGGPGYNIPDEFVSTHKFDIPGRLAMANTGRPNSGGSQFFITQVPYPSLNGGYSVFGQVVEGQDVVNKVCATLGSPSGKPTKDVILRKLTIETVAGK
ncbi:MAG: peptidylprolyl isomerase [Acidobacteria bacterium]|nr:peptidylprolyl isomerase [Acidobacteriota bacterium]